MAQPPQVLFQVTSAAKAMVEDHEWQSHASWRDCPTFKLIHRKVEPGPSATDALIALKRLGFNVPDDAQNALYAQLADTKSPLFAATQDVAVLAHKLGIAAKQGQVSEYSIEGSKPLSALVMCADAMASGLQYEHSNPGQWRKFRDNAAFGLVARDNGRQ